MNAADFARRRSWESKGAASHLIECEEKENDEKDSILKASKLQSLVKGYKNFMVPMISTASKCTPSPRKKVLVERNDPVRTSISLSDGKTMFFSTMPNVSESELGSLDSNLADSESELGVSPNSQVLTRLLASVSFSSKAALNAVTDVIFRRRRGWG